MGRHILASRLVRETRDALLRAGARSQDIDLFVAELVDASPAVARSVCEAWREKYSSQPSAVSRQQNDGDLVGALSPVKKSGTSGRKRQVKHTNAKKTGRLSTKANNCQSEADLSTENGKRQTENALLCRAETPAECAQCPVSRFFDCLMAEEPRCG